MTSAFEQALAALAAGVTARKLYFSGHPAVEQNVRTALKELNAALASEREVTAHVIDGRVVGPAGCMTQSDAIRSGLFGALERQGRTSIKFSRGVGYNELAALVSALGGEDAELPVLTGISLGVSAVREGTEGAGERAPGVSEAVGAFQLAIEEQDAGGRTQANKMQGVAAGICAAVGGAKGTMLELAVLKSHDEYTYVHTVNVAMLAAALAETVGLSPEQVHHITLAALMHDLGKRAMPLAILNKQGPLDDAERQIMNRHPVEGARMLMGAPGMPEIATIVAFEHHMHLDGSGYPLRPKHWKPHLSAQIVQQADVFDALRTHRPYRRAMSTEKAVEILLEGSGTKYDAALVDIFTKRVVTRSGGGLADNPSTEPAKQEPGDRKAA